MENKPAWLIVHHTGGTDADPLADTSHHTFDMVKNYHISKGWEDIGYHYFIEKGGAIKQGRAENYHGAHTVGYNTVSLGICLAGNFDITLPTQEQINALAGLLTHLKLKYLIQADKIVPHRKFANKSCYGLKLPDTWARGLVAGTSDSNDIKLLITDLQKIIDKYKNTNA